MHSNRISLRMCLCNDAHEVLSSYCYALTIITMNIIILFLLGAAFFYNQEIFNILIEIFPFFLGWLFGLIFAPNKLPIRLWFKAFSDKKTGYIVPSNLNFSKWATKKKINSVGGLKNYYFEFEIRQFSGKSFFFKKKDELEYILRFEK